MTPDELRMFANQWRNVADVSRRTVEAMIEAEAPLSVISLAATVVDYTVATAAALEERASRLEQSARTS